VDNFMDAAHFPFVHAATFGVPESAEVHAAPLERGAASVRSVFDAPYRNFDDPLVATGEHELVQPHHVEKIGMASLNVGLRLTFPVTGAVFVILYACQAERDGSTRIFKVMARNDFHGRAGEWERLVKEEDVVLGEDLAILERYRHGHVDLEPQNEIHTRADRLSVAWRHLMADLAGMNDGPPG
jgi:vanillate O-demethylase monooxygenase subunit